MSSFLPLRVFIPNDMAAVSLATDLASSVLRRLGLDPEDREGIELALTEELGTIIRLGFLPDERQEIEVELSLDGTDFRIAIRDHGLPYTMNELPDFVPEPATPEPDSVDGQGEFLARMMMDEVRHLNHGKDGKETVLLKSLADTHASEIFQEAETTPSSVEEPRPLPPDLEIRAVRPDEARDVSECVYFGYGLSYVYEDLYYPERVKALIESGEVTSVMALSESDGILGHIALFRPSPEATVSEWGMAVVDPAYRGQGLMTTMVEAILTEGKRQELAGLFAHSVTSHPATQKICRKYAFHDTALLLGYAPKSLKFRKMKEELPQRESTMINFRYLREPEAVELHLPTWHEAMLTRIYDPFGLEIRDGTPSAEAASSHSRLESRLTAYLNMADIILRTAGKDFPEVLRHRLMVFRLKGTDVVYLHLDLEDHDTPEACRAAETLGFFFAGVQQGHPFDHTLTLQYLHDLEIDYEAITVVSDTARALRDYIRDLDPLNR